MKDRKRASLICLFVACTLFIAGCRGYSIDEFVENIIPGYQPLEKVYVEDQFRIGFLKAEARDFSFDERVTGTIEKRYVATRNVSFDLDSNTVARFDAKVQRFISAGLSYNKVDRVSVRAEGIAIYYYPTNYNIYVREGERSLVEKLKVVKEVVQADLLSFEVTYKDGFAGRAELEKEIKGITDAAAKVEITGNRSFKVTYEDRPVAFNLEPVAPERLKVIEGEIIIYGRVSPKAGEPRDGIKVEARFSTGLSPVATVTDPYGRYTLVIKAPQSLARIVALKGDEVVGEKVFNPMNPTFEFNLP